MTDPNTVGSLESDGDLKARVLELSARAETSLNAHARTRDLVAGLPREDSSPLRIAVWGPYSAGKSTLIAALLRLPPEAVNEPVSAEPKTLKPTPYEWNGAVLLDLPGTLAGIDAHSDAARVGMRSADVLMIVTTSELAGETETKAIRQALDADGFADRGIVVINKMNAENSDPDVILDETRNRLGAFADRVPILPTDALDYLDAINDPSLEEDERESLISGSGVAALADHLRSFIETDVSSVRAKAQAFELARVLTDAEEQWHLEGEALNSAETARAVADTISQATERVQSSLGIGSEVVASVIRTAGNTAASSVSEKDPSVSDDVLRDADEKRTDAIASFEARVAESMRTAFDALLAQYGNQVPEPEPWAFDDELLAVTFDEPPTEESQLELNAVDAAKNLVKLGSGKFNEFIAKVADSGSENGSLASNMATRINQSRLGQKLLGGERVGDGAGKFRPYGRGKAADKVAGAAGKLQWAAIVIGPALNLKGVADDQLKRMKIDRYRKDLRNRFNAEALRTQDALTDSGTRWLNEWIVEVEQSLSDLTNEGARIIAERETAMTEINFLRVEAENLLRVGFRT